MFSISLGSIRCFLPVAALVLVALLLQAVPVCAAERNNVTGRAECGENLDPADRLHCENVLLDAADAELNRAYQATMDILDAQAATLLRTAQRAWLAYRDMNFESFSAADPEQGQQGLAERVRDLRILTKQRSAELQRLALLAVKSRAGSPAGEEPPAETTVETPSEAFAETPDTAPEGTAEKASETVAPAPTAPPASEPAEVQQASATPQPETDLVVAVTPPVTPEPKRTVVISETARNELLGRHSMRLQWLSNVPSGLVEIVDRDGELWLSGHQGSGANMLLVEGRISTVREDSFTLHGRVVIRVDFLGDGKPCLREGSLWFVRKSGRPFWRLQSISSPCSGVSDYVDIAVNPEP